MYDAMHFLVMPMRACNSYWHHIFLSSIESSTIVAEIKYTFSKKIKKTDLTNVNYVL